MLAGIVTVVAFIAFIAGVAWAMSGKRKREFDEAGDTNRNGEQR